MGVRDVLVWPVGDGMFPDDAVAGGHGEVGEESDCGDEGCYCVEEPVLLMDIVSFDMLLFP